MSVNRRASLDTGRVNQKVRTRDTLVSVAAELLHRGQEFSVADVADIARMGRTTAYRYFPTRELLLAHAALWKLANLEQREFNHVFDRPSAQERVEALVRASDASTRLHEKEYRAMLRLSLETAAQEDDAPPRRSAFRRESIVRALEPVKKQLGSERFERLVGALAMLIGIEPLVVARDVISLDLDRAREIKCWAASVMLDSALQEGGTQSKITKLSKTAGTRNPRRGGG